jgi:Zn-dependent protease/CBS domain-containing protein
MSGTILLGSLFGIKVRIHFSWFFIFVLFAWLLASNVLAMQFPDWSFRTRLLVGIVESAMLFVSVLIHEFSHSLVAIRRGHTVRSITLFFLGGVSEIEDESESAADEFLISFVGPLTSLVLGALLMGAGWLITSSNDVVGTIVLYLGFMNLGLGVFNLIPAYPLDGGRVLKSLVWKATGNQDKAINVSSLAGSMLGFFLIGLGVFFAISGNLLNGLWLVFIGWFIQSTASSTRREQVTQRVLSGKTVRDAMSDEVPTVPPGVTVEGFLNGYVMKEFRRAYVVGFGEAIRGLITVNQIRSVPEEERPRKYITEVMIPANQITTIGPDDSLESALSVLVTTGFHQLLVVEKGRPVGMLTRGDVLRVLEISELFPPEAIRRAAAR